MSALLSLLTGGNGLLLGLGAALVAVFGAFMKGRLSGAKAERAKQAEAEQKARDVYDEVQSDVGVMTPEQRRKALKTWSRE